MGSWTDKVMGVKGVNAYARRAKKSGEPNLAALSRASGVDPTTLRKVKNGERGLSLKASRDLAKLAGTGAPLSLFVESHTRALKSRITAGGDSPGQEAYLAALRGITAVFEELNNVSDEEKSYEESELAKVLQEFAELANQVIRNAGGPGYPKATTKAVEVPKPEGEPVKRDAAGRAIRSNGNSLERDPLTGKRVRK